MLDKRVVKEYIDTYIALIDGKSDKNQKELLKEECDRLMKSILRSMVYKFCMDYLVNLKETKAEESEE